MARRRRTAMASKAAATGMSITATLAGVGLIGHADGTPTANAITASPVAPVFATLPATLPGDMARTPAGRSTATTVTSATIIDTPTSAVVPAPAVIPAQIATPSTVDPLLTAASTPLRPAPTTLPLPLPLTTTPVTTVKPRKPSTSGVAAAPEAGAADVTAAPAPEPVDPVATPPATPPTTPPGGMQPQAPADTQPAVTQPPVTQLPVTQPPVTQPPVTQPPPPPAPVPPPATAPPDTVSQGTS